MKRTLVLVYAITCYAIFHATFLYAPGFIGGFAAPKSIDGVPRVGLGEALLIDAALLGVFARQRESVTACPRGAGVRQQG